MSSERFTTLIRAETLEVRVLTDRELIILEDNGHVSTFVWDKEDDYANRVASHVEMYNWRRIT